MRLFRREQERMVRIMNTFEITQSVNWYKSNILTMNKCGDLMAYGSRSIIVLVKGLEGNSVYDLQYNRLKLNTKMSCGRIGAVSFSHGTNNYKDAFYLASIDEVNIYIWKVENVVWLYNCLTVVAISDSGTLHKWDIQALTMRTYTLDIKVSPLTLAACPHKKNIIAIGCKNGNLIVYDLTGDGQLLHKVRYHERNIVSLAWCPVPYNPLNSDQSTEPLLLASTASDRTGLYICRAGLDMFREATVSLPMKPLRKSIFKNKTNLNWSCIKWIKPTMIIVTSSFGEILKVEFKSGNNFEPIVTLISESHKDIIFSMTCPSESTKPYLWSSCMGRKLIRTPLFNTTETGELPLEVPTLGGFVYCFSLSPVNSADFAFGLGDGRIYYWNVSNKRQLELITLNYSIDSKVLSLAFHPLDEGLLAFGTADGRIGIINLTRKRNNVNMLKTVLAHSVYRLCWAPLPNTKLVDNAKLSLYAVGNGQIIIYNEMNLWKDPYNLKEYVQFNDIEDKLTTPVKRIEMAWTFNYNIVAIGNSNGSIYLLDGDTLKLKNILYGHEQSVECIIWHPTHVTCDYSEESKYKNYFASSSHSIRIHKLNEDGTPSLVVEFKGHKEKINEVAWSPHRNLILLSCSNDFTAKVWDVQKCTLIGVYSKHLCTILCGIFSPLDYDIVFTGSADHSVHSWRISKDLHNDVVDLKKNKDTPNIVKEIIVMKDNDNSKPGNTESRLQQFPLSSYDLYMGKYLEEAVYKFIDSNYHENKTYVDSKQINYLAFFGKTEEMKELLVKEYHALKLKSSNQITSCINNINMWGQNLEGYFNDAIETKTINDWMISVAPTVSYDLWTKMCEVYAGQLEDIGDVTKASTYLIAIKKVKEAAIMLLKNNLFREALATIRSQEKQDDNTILEITKKWAEYNNLHGHPKEAAHCYLSIGDAQNAISCLMKVKQVKELTLAAQLARYVDEELEQSLVINILKMEYFKHHKWNEARELLKNHPKLFYLKMWVDVHEAMFQLDTKVTQNIFKNWIYSTANEGNISILDYIIKNVEYKPDYYDKLVKTVESEFISDTLLLMPKITVFIAGQFCLIALQYKKTGLITTDSQKHLIKCFAVAYNYETVHTDSKSKFNKLLTRLLMWIFPQGPLTLDLCSNFELNENLMKTIRAYLGYVCFSWLHPIYTSLNKKINQVLKENDIDERKNENYYNNYEEISILTNKFQQLLNNYIHNIIDIETSNYFKAKKEIERIDRLLSTCCIPVEIQNNESTKSIKAVGELEDIQVSESKRELLELNVSRMESLTENMKECEVVNYKLSKLNKDDESNFSKSHQYKEINNDQNNYSNKNYDLVGANDNSAISDCKIKLTNSLEQNACFTDLNNLKKIENFKKEVAHFFQNIETELNKYHNYSNDQSTIKHVAHLETEASKKKELEIIVAEFEKNRINSPNPFTFVAELNCFIHAFDQLK
ncbi:Hypothetical protein CINCED_3A004867 [Cinara cedri]|uniref:Uncharacterized protein n=1 Tax=Cinara cedri TaxID=506608 RepID=A0A5E4NAW4_9HEMI|nr:Hypothetical protein CINCED_3A004867 [Cinara cedri]